MIEAAPGQQSNESPVGLLYHSASQDTSGIAPALDSEGIERRFAEAPLHLNTVELPTVLLVDGSLLNDASSLRALPGHVILVAVGRAAETAFGRSAAFAIPADASTELVLRTLRGAYQLAAARLSASRAERELARTRD